MSTAEIITAICKGFTLAGMFACVVLGVVFVAWLAYLGYVAWLQAGEREEAEGVE